ncbi:MAG TPA: trimeric intracellular cation channel family protein [Bacteroidales bacterium]|nr:trimeric intracellular cation channel family protein [Bacteroidales bacterium]
MNWLNIITYSGTFVFAITGTLKARTHKMDVFGAAVLAFCTAYGGGTIRDILLGIRPVNWLGDYFALTLVISAVLIIFLFKTNMDKFNRVIFITDAIGLGMFTIAGIQISMQAGIGSVYSVIMGVITATFGGLVTDILCNNIPDLLKNGEMYATACFIGGLVFILLIKLGIHPDVCILICVLLIVSLRVLSKVKKIHIPRFK